MSETDNSHVLIEFHQDGIPGFATVDTSFSDISQKEQYSWHLSILVAYSDLVQNKLPSSTEQKLLYEFEDLLNSEFSSYNNALFFGRVTWNERRELMWRVIDPVPPDEVLQGIIQSQSHPRPIDYRIDHDPAWKKAVWYLDGAAASEPANSPRPFTPPPE